MRKRWIFFVISVATVAASAKAGTYLDDIGYTRLTSEQGANTPTGTGVSVTQIEAPEYDSDDYFPDTTNSQFAGKIITPQTSPYTTSYHATLVGGYFYGDTNSVAPGITSINAYNVGNWIYEQFLNASTNELPYYTTDRVANHSYIGYATLSDNTTFDPVGTLDILHRFDYVIQHDDYINVVAVNDPGNGGSQPLMADSFNAISVGLTNGLAASGTTNELEDPQGLYVGGRAAPDVVAPLSATSWASPLVASTAAMLVELAHNNPSLSAGSFISPRTGLTLEYGETNDVIKAAIMAGADRVTSNSSTTDQITNFGAAGYETQNGLDTRFGAGQLDVYNSYHIIAGAQQGPGTISTYGFDYNPSSSDTAVEDYTFSGEHGIAATLAWNIHIDNSLSASLANYQLHLYQLTESGSIAIAASVSTIDNTQNIFVPALNPLDTYELQVTRTDALGNWDYGLAWDLDPVPEPAAGMMFLAGLAASSRFRRRRSSTRGDGV